MGDDSKINSCDKAGELQKEATPSKQYKSSTELYKPSQKQPEVVELDVSSEEGIQIVEQKVALPQFLPSYRSRTARLMKFDPKKIAIAGSGIAQKENTNTLD